MSENVRFLPLLSIYEVVLNYRLQYGSGLIVGEAECPNRLGYIRFHNPITFHDKSNRIIFRRS